MMSGAVGVGARVTPSMVGMGRAVAGRVGRQRGQRFGSGGGGGGGGCGVGADGVPCGSRRGVARDSATAARATKSFKEGLEEFEKEIEKTAEAFLEKEFPVREPGDMMVDKSDVEDPVTHEKEYDIYRDSLLRYMGYANEVGEAFTAYLPAWGVPASYGVAATYVLMDTLDKGAKRWKKHEGDDDRAQQAGAVALDTFTWQMFASVFWPGSFIRVVVASTTLALAAADLDGGALSVGGVDVAKALPTVAGLATIPLIVKPIDKVMDAAGDASFSKALKGEMESPGDWAVGGAIFAGCLALPPALFALAAAINDTTASL